MSTELHARVDNAIARVRSVTINNGQPTDFDFRRTDEVLAEIAKTHVLVPRALAERAAQARGMGSRAAFDRGVICGDLARYWEEQGS